jgi:hypothetical protein
MNRGQSASGARLLHGAVNRMRSLISLKRSLRGHASGRSASINRAAGGDRPELFDAVSADADIPVVEVYGRVAMAGDEVDLVADLKTVGGARDAEPSALVGGALGGGGGFVADERGTRVEGERLEAGIDDRAVLGRAVHLRRVTEGLGSKALVETPSRSTLRP